MPRKRTIKPTMAGVAAWATGHERLCTLRYRETGEQIKSMDKKIDERHAENQQMLLASAEERRQGFRELKDEISKLKQSEKTRNEQEAQAKLATANARLKWVIRLVLPSLGALLTAMGIMAWYIITHGKP